MGISFKVCIPHTHRDYFDYCAGEQIPQTGARVWVPFRQQQKLGVVIGSHQDANPSIKLKTIAQVVDQQPLIPEELLTLCSWVARYYQSPLSEVIPLALPKRYRLGNDAILPTEDYYQLATSLEKAQAVLPKRARKQLALIELLAQEKTPVSKKVLQQQGFSASQFAPLLAAQLLHLSQEVSLPVHAVGEIKPALTLNTEQASAVAAIQQHLNQYQCFLLHGVTGSGKTEVYFHTISEVLKHDKQVLILVPEIGLTPQLLSRFTERFYEPIAVIHSNLNETERQVAWQLALENRVKIIIGTRASVFTPMPHLGLIIIDEEHDSSLKQMEGVRYSARDTALMRAHLANIPIILGSATPSLESLYNCQQNKYRLLCLTHKALSTQPLHYQLIDLRAQMLHQGLTATTLQIIKEHLANNNQVLVFINRRGFAPVLLCHQCGWMMDCKACDSHLTVHQQTKQMICHHCGLMTRPPTQCQSCHSSELIPVGSGTQRIHQYLSEYFPATTVVRIDRDEVRHKHDLAQQLDRIHQGEAQLIVGTQMLAKGHHFPRLSLVVILDVDVGFYNQDFRALEHLGQLITQVSGRAGRAKQQGQVLIQTHLPHHPALNTLIQQGYEAFAQELLAIRQQAQMPPFHHLAVLRAQSTSADRVLKLLHATKKELHGSSLSLLGPAPAPLPRKANQYRMQLLIKSPSRPLLQTVLNTTKNWLSTNKLAQSVRWNIDVDPIDLS
jgi:primosomal protein N' (replication factor Y)